MNRISKIAALVVRLTLALLCVLGGQGGDAWMVLNDGGDEEAPT